MVVSSPRRTDRGGCGGSTTDALQALSRQARLMLAGGRILTSKER
ncbi:MAG TPA: hypothetical protein VHJ83_17155 [Micromonosporaceae bacterium]|nr:hypothetical protein [Micromonosporaceae bacterium]